MATSEYNLEGLRSDVTSYIDGVRDSLESVLDNDFLVRVANWIDTDNSLGSIRNAIDISVDSLGDVETLLQSVIDNVSTSNLPERPSELSETIVRDKEHVFLSDRLDSLTALAKDVYTQEIGNTGYAYDNMVSNKIEAISNAIYEKGYDIAEDDLSVTVDRLAAKWAADGYSIAPSALSFDIAQMINEFDAKIESSINSPASMLASAIQENIQWAFENGISIEKLHMEFAVQSTKFKQEQISGIVKAYIGEIEKVQMEIGLPLKNIATILKAAETDNSVNITETELKLDRELGDLAAVISGIGIRHNADAGLLKRKSEIIAGTADGYIGLFSTLGSLFTGVTVQEQQVDN